jgi:type IV pilus assembly protein PilQ
MPPIILFSIAALQAFASCMHRPSAEVETVQEVNTLNQIEVADLGDRLRIEIDSGHAVAYSVSTGVEPASVTVELPGLSKGSGLEMMEINKPPVLQMIPSEVTKPVAGLQLMFLVANPVKPEAHTEGTRLMIDFPKGDQVQAKQPASEEVASASEAIARPLAERSSETPADPPSTPPVSASPATVMTKVDVEKGEENATVVLMADGELTYDVKRLSGDRLVVDLPNIISQVRSQVLPVQHPLLKQIRIGAHTKKVRLVLDLSAHVDYSLTPGEKRLAIRLVPGADREKTGAIVRRDGAQGEQPDAGREPSRVRVAAAGSRVPFPERLAMVEAKPALVPTAVQIPAEAKPVVEAEEPGQPRFSGRRISLDFQAADISNVLRLIAEVSGFNIVVGEGVKAKVTMKLVGVPWDQALDMLLKMNNLGMIREGNIVWIDSLANIAKQQDEEAKAKESKTKAEDLVTRVLYVQNITAQELQTTLRQYVGPRGQLQVNAASNALVVQDTESRVAAFAELVRSLDLQVPQVQIEARIVQADTSYSRSLGVQWGASNANSTQGGTGINFVGNQTGPFAEQQTSSTGSITRTFNVNLPAAVAGLASVPGAGFTFGKINSLGGLALDLRLSAGELLGLTKVIAAPKITTLDKREAKISQGESIPFQTTSLQGTQTTFVDANLELQVTPQITSRDPREVGKNVLLKIRATRNAVGARSNPAGPSIDKREATTQILVRDGETMVIGGIFVDSQTNTVGGVPYLARIPVLGWLFKNKTETIAKQELLIFLTPTIVKT